MIVSKFGGTSVANSEAIRQVYSIVTKRSQSTFIVVSAFAKITDTLISLVEHLKKKDISSVHNTIDRIFDRHFNTAKELGIDVKINDFLHSKKEELHLICNALTILGEISPRSIDLILSYGELLSSYLIYLFFLSKGHKIVYVDPRKIIKTDSNFTGAEVDFKATKMAINQFMQSINEFDLIITGGFVGSNLEGITTTLGRGGSDYSAAVIASVIGASELEIWTDVDGIMTTDPNLVPSAKVLEEVTYNEASEMAIFGAKVLHPKTIFPAIDKRIPVFVKNTFKPDGKGTLISYKPSRKKEVKAITFRKNVTVINIRSNRMLGAYGYLARVFEIFKRFETEVDLVSTSEVSISLTVNDTKHLASIVKELREISEVEVLENYVIVAVIGEGLKNSSKVASRIFNTLQNIKIQMVSMGASDINLSIVVREEDMKEAVRLLHKEFFGL